MTIIKETTRQAIMKNTTTTYKGWKIEYYGFGYYEANRLDNENEETMTAKSVELLKIDIDELGLGIGDIELVECLYDICDREHSVCNNNCPVFSINGKIPDTVQNIDINGGCDCFKSGRLMLEFIKSNTK